MSREPQSLVLELLRNIRVDVARVDDKVETVKADLRSEIRSLRADVAADFVAVRKEMGEQIAGLRRAVVEYHSAVLGHGVLNSELEARVRRIEQHLSLPEMDASRSRHFYESAARTLARLPSSVDLSPVRNPQREYQPLSSIRTIIAEPVFPELAEPRAFERLTN